MIKVYLATTYPLNDSRYVGIYSTLEKAKEELEKIEATGGFLVKWEAQNNSWKCNHYDEICQYIIDEIQLDRTYSFELVGLEYKHV